MRLHDPNGDGRVRLSEIEQEGLACLFDESGSVYAGLEAYISINLFFFSEKFSVPITPPITLLDFNHSCPPGPPPQPVLATMESGGVLALNMGPLAHNRDVGDVADGNENFTVGPGPVANSVIVTDVGLTYNGQPVKPQKFYNVTSIEADGGLGDNTIAIEPGVSLPVHLIGGSGKGKDSIYDYGSGQAFLAGGGSGGDTIIYGSATAPGSGAGPATLYGGSGNDLLDASASTGNVSIYGAGGDDTAKGGSGSDYLQAGRGNSQLFSNSTTDASTTLAGGSGNEALVAGAGHDLLEAGTGFASLVAGSGPDTLVGGNGSDVLDAEQVEHQRPPGRRARHRHHLRRQRPRPDHRRHIDRHE